MTSLLFFRARMVEALRPAGVHFFISATVAVAVYFFIFNLWYPWPMDKMTTGRELFVILVCVDVICGPVLTMVVWSKYKTRRHAIMDVGFIVVLQSIALTYGLYTASLARPVAMVFEADRLRIVVASEIDPNDLMEAPPDLQNFPWAGPVLLSVREAKSTEEFLKSIDMSLAGKEPSIRPGWWQPYERGVGELLKRARPLSDIFNEKPNQAKLLHEAVEKSGVGAEDLVWLPLTSAISMDWIVLLDKKYGLPKSYAPIDGFF